MTITNTIISILENPDGCSLKRAAWAYGCAKQGSEEETLLLAVLRSKIGDDARRLAILAVDVALDAALGEVDRQCSGVMFGRTLIEARGTGAGAAHPLLTRIGKAPA